MSNIGRFQILDKLGEGEGVAQMDVAALREGLEPAEVEDVIV